MLNAPFTPSSNDNRSQIELPCLGGLKYKIIQKYNHALCTITTYIVDASTKLQQQFRELMTPLSEESEEMEGKEMTSEEMTIEEVTIEEVTTEEVTTEEVTNEKAPSTDCTRRKERNKTS